MWGNVLCSALTDEVRWTLKITITAHSYKQINTQINYNLSTTLQRLGIGRPLRRDFYPTKLCRCSISSLSFTVAITPCTMVINTLVYAYTRIWSFINFLLWLFCKAAYSISLLSNLSQVEIIIICGLVIHILRVSQL